MTGKFPLFLSCSPIYGFSDQIQISSPPFDSISTVRFSPTNRSHLLVSSWDTVSFFSLSTSQHSNLFVVFLTSSRDIQVTDDHPSRLWDYTTSIQMNRSQNMIIVQPFWHVVSPVLTVHTVEALTLRFGSMSCLTSPYRDSMRLSLHVRLDLNTEKINHLGQHSNAISAMNYSKDLSASISSSEIPATLTNSLFLNLSRRGGHRLLG